jgi:hypothetical protein
MSTKARKPSTGSQKQNARLRKDVQAALDRVWPDGIVELSFDPDESYFDEVHPKLARGLNRIPHAQLVQERQAKGGPIWRDDSDPEEDPPDDMKHSRSYHVFFVTPRVRPLRSRPKPKVFQNPSSLPKSSKKPVGESVYR